MLTLAVVITCLVGLLLLLVGLLLLLVGAIWIITSLSSDDPDLRSAYSFLFGALIFSCGLFSTIGGFELNKRLKWEDAARESTRQNGTMQNSGATGVER